MPSNPTRQAQERAALVALVRRIEEVGVRPGTDLAEAVAGAHAALAASETSEPASTVVEILEHPGKPVSAMCILNGCQHMAPAPVGEPPAAPRVDVEALIEETVGHCVTIARLSPSGKHAKEMRGYIKEAFRRLQPQPEGASPS
jgi:hypothetical protein